MNSYIAIERAYYLLDRLIALGKTKTEKYYGDYIKVEALLYLWHCLYMYVYDIDLLKVSIIITEGKLHIGDELCYRLIARYGFDKIRELEFEVEEQKGLCVINGEIREISIEPQVTKYKPVVLRAPFLQEGVLKVILNVFGSFNTEQLIEIIKNTYAYKEGIKKVQSNVELDNESLIATGEQIYDLITSNKEEKQDAYFIMNSFKESYLKIKSTSKDESAKKRELARFPKSTE